MLVLSVIILLMVIVFRWYSHSSHSFNSLDLANTLLETEVPDLIQPNEVTCSVVTENNASVAVSEPSGI